MVSILVAILPTLLTILGFIVKERFSEEGIKKRSDYERDKEIAEKDHGAKSRRLSNLFDLVKLRNAKKGSGSSS